MTTHEFARYLLENTKDLPLLMVGRGGDDGTTFLVGGTEFIEPYGQHAFITVGLSGAYGLSYGEEVV